jgi:hypothetical protein
LPPALLPVAGLLVILYLTKSYLPTQKGSFQLLLYFLYNGIVIAIATAMYYFSSKIFKEAINSIITTVFQKFINSNTQTKITN